MTEQILSPHGDNVRQFPKGDRFIPVEPEFLRVSTAAFRSLLANPDGWLFAFFKPAQCHTWEADISHLVRLGYEHHGCWVCKRKGLPNGPRNNGWCHECAEKRERGES